jgi:hypothetical protein
MSLECIWCEDWKPNSEKVDAPMVLLHARNPSTYKGYDGKPFKFCPWCGQPLYEVATSPSQTSVSHEK